MPSLARYEEKPIIFHEVKANMTRAEVESLRRAHVVWIQPETAHGTDVSPDVRAA